MPHAHHHHNFFHYFLNRELSEIYITVAGRAFAISLIGIFVPIYLFQMGFDLSYIFLFYALISATFAITVFFSTKLSTKIGIKHGMLISIPFLITHYILLRFITPNTLDWIFFLAPIVAGINGSFFWSNFHIDFARFSSKKLRAEQVSGYAITCAVLSALGPVIGSLILLYVGFNFLFVLVSVLLLISIVPLFMSGETHIPKDFSAKNIYVMIKKTGRKGIFGYVGYGMVLCSISMWPLFIFLILRTYLNVGSLISACLFAGMISTFFVGRLADRYGKGKVLRIGSLLCSIGWFIIAFIKTAIQIAGMNIFLGITTPASAGGPAYDALNYDMAKKKHIAEIITVREIILRCSLALVFFLLFFINNLKVAFVYGVVGSLFIIIFSYQKKKI